MQLLLVYLIMDKKPPNHTNQKTKKTKPKPSYSSSDNRRLTCTADCLWTSIICNIFKKKIGKIRYYRTCHINTKSRILLIPIYLPLILGLCHPISWLFSFVGVLLLLFVIFSRKTNRELTLHCIIVQKISSKPECVPGNSHFRIGCGKELAKEVWSTLIKILMPTVTL